MTLHAQPKDYLLTAPRRISAYGISYRITRMGNIRITRGGNIRVTHSATDDGFVLTAKAKDYMLTAPRRMT